MNDPSPCERKLGNTIRSIFGGRSKVVLFGDDDGTNTCFIVSASDCPVNGVTSYASVGLSRIAQEVGPLDIEVEIVAACASITPHVDNLVASCVFEGIKNGVNISYGSIIKDIIVQYNISATLKHVTFVAPFLWDNLNKLEVEGKSIYCLMMLPISDAEISYLVEHGIDALEELFYENQIDVYDINRPSAIG